MPEEQYLAFVTHDGKTELGLYNMRAGEGQRSHAHAYGHDAFVLAGTVVFEIGSVGSVLEAPASVHFPTGAEHAFWAKSESAVVLVVHPILPAEAS
jgi:quercetin dioxygenase-like cupin family protein